MKSCKGLFPNLIPKDIASNPYFYIESPPAGRACTITYEQNQSGINDKDKCSVAEHKYLCTIRNSFVIQFKFVILPLR